MSFNEPKWNEKAACQLGAGVEVKQQDYSVKPDILLMSLQSAGIDFFEPTLKGAATESETCLQVTQQQRRRDLCHAGFGDN